MPRTAPPPKTNASTTASPSRKHTTQHADLLGKVGFQSSSKHLLPEDTGQNNAFTDESISSPSSQTNSPLKFECTLNDEYTSNSRVTTGIQFHSKYDNIIVTSHGARIDGKLGHAQGTIGVWAFDQKEENVLQRTLISSTPVNKLQLFSISPTLVLAGTNTGCIHLWDLRVQSSLPILAFDKHSIDISDCHGRHAITSINTTLSTSPYFMTTSSNGHICKWTLSQLNGPISQSNAYDSSISDKVSIRTMDLPKSIKLSPDDHQKLTNRSPSLFIGTSYGAVCRLEHDGKLWNAESKRGFHKAPITSLNSHPSGIYVPHLDDVIATSSYDWFLNVWYFRRGQHCKKLWSHDNSLNGAIHDIAWSSLHPTVICYGDESGSLSLNDLSGHLRNESNGTANWKFFPSINNNNKNNNHNHNHNFNSSVSSSSSNTRRAPINKVQWSANNKYICAGDKIGNISLWSTTSHMASVPADAEWLATFLKIKSNNYDQLM